MGRKKPVTKSEWIDTDDAPELTQEWFDSADYYEGGKLIRVGRRKSDTAKESISLRLDAEVRAYFRATGPGWQARINAALRKVAKL